jgi:hypothetical protein
VAQLDDVAALPLYDDPAVLHAVRSPVAPGSRLRNGAWVAALLLVSCQPSPSPVPASPEPTPAVTANATQLASATQPPGSARPAPTTMPPPAPITSRDKILAALRSGSIDAETALAYRVFAVFGDPRLPAELQSVESEDIGALFDARHRIDELSLATQELIRPYLVRPTHPESYWNTEPPAGSARLTAARNSRAPSLAAQAAPTCTGGWMNTRVSANIPVMIWSQCFGSALGAQAAMEEARGYMVGLWGPMTRLMVVPPGDRNFPNDDWDDMPETGDGLIDIYLLDGFTPSGHARDFSIGWNHGVASWTPPFEGSDGSRSSSSYLIIRAGLRGLDLETTLAHEFFHALGFAINFEGMSGCPIGSLAGCPDATPEWFWMVEASATWAEHYFVPAARATADGPYDRFKLWRSTNQGLSQVGGVNAYASWMWPLFMQQQAGAASVGRAWRAFGGKSTWNQLQAALDGVVPFDQAFKEFAVRGWNQILSPGDPLGRHYFDQSLDASFPRDTPERGRLLEPINLDVNSSGPTIEDLIIDSLAPKYLPFRPGSDARTVVFDFIALSPEIDVVALVQLEDGAWERRELPQSQVTWCLDDPTDAVVAGILVFANHDQRPGVITRTWSWEAKPSGCGQPDGTLTYHFVDWNPVGGLPGSRHTEQATIQVSLKQDPDVPFEAFINDGSTFGAGTFMHIVLPPDLSGCNPFIDTTGTPGGALDESSVVGSLFEDTGETYLSISISLPIHVQTRESWCALGTSSSSGESSILIPSCDGREEAGAPAPLRRFRFDCRFDGETQQWAVTGYVIVVY